MTRRLIVSLFVFAVVSAPWLAATTYAQTQPMPDTLPRVDAPMLNTTLPPAPPAAEPYEITADPPSAGSLLAETIAAAATTLAVGTLSVAWGLHEDPVSFDVLGVLPPFLLAAPLLSSLATSLAGAATGGDGGWLYSFAASAGAAGMTSGIALVVMVVATVSIYGFQEFHDEEEAAELRRSAHAVALILGGMIMGATTAGAVIGYRASARRSQASYAVSAAPTRDGRGGMLLIGGAL